MKVPVTTAKGTDPKSATQPGQMVYVGFWQRFLAFLIDSVAAMVVITPLAMLVVGELDMELYDQTDPAVLLSLLQELTLRLSFDLTVMGVLVVLFWIFRSATPGKMVISAIIVNAADGGKPAPWQMLVRYLAYFVSTIPLFIGFLWIGISARKQGWHDLLARTVVIKQPMKDEGQS